MWNAEYERVARQLRSFDIPDDAPPSQWSVRRLLTSYPLGRIVANIDRAHRSPTWKGKAYAPNAGRVIGAIRENWAQWNPDEEAERRRRREVQRHLAAADDEARRRRADEAEHERERADARIDQCDERQLRELLEWAVDRAFPPEGAFSRRVNESKRKAIIAADLAELRTLAKAGPIGTMIRARVEVLP